MVYLGLSLDEGDVFRPSRPVVVVSVGVGVDRSHTLVHHDQPVRSVQLLQPANENWFLSLQPDLNLGPRRVVSIHIGRGGAYSVYAIEILHKLAF